MPRPERPVDPEGGVVQRFAVELRNLRKSAGSPGYRELARLAQYSSTSLAQAARGENLPTLALTLAYVRACGGDTNEWEARWRAAAAELGPRLSRAEADADQPDGRAPYVGLAVYGPDDADRFCGRDHLIAKVTDRLARQRFVAVVGASGSGKSSLLRAGVLPALSADGDRWSTLLITPGPRPLEECAVRLGTRLGLSAHQLAAELAEDPLRLGLSIRELMADRPDDAEFLLVVDQFEEIFTLCGDSRERDGFVTALLHAAHDPGSRTRVVLGLRADFYAHCARHVQLVEALQDAQVLVGPMSSAELGEAITQPAVRAGLMVEKSLVTTVVGEAAGRVGALPFVSHALWETWRRRHGTSLLLTEYQAAGGVNGAVAQSADRVYEGLNEGQQQAARRILVRLTALGDGTEDTRRRVARAELGADATTADVLERLTAARLLTVAEDTVEIAHEALIGGWPVLREWLTADREALRAHRRLTDVAAEWDRRGRDEGYLYRGRLLVAWQDHDPGALNETEREFLAESVARHDQERTARQRRVRRSLIGLSAAALVTSLLAGLALVQSTRRGEERDLALSRQLAADARSQLSLDPELGLLLAIKAFETRPTAEAEAVLRQAMVDSRLITARPTGQGHFTGSLGVTFSPDGTQVVTTGDDGTVRIWQRDGEKLSPADPIVLHGHDGESWSPVFSPDGRYLATSGSDSTVRVWDLTGHDEPVVLRGHRGRITNVTFSPDGQRLASSTDDGIRVWDPRGRRDPVLLQGHIGPAKGIAFSPEGDLLASAGEDATLRMWDLATLREVSVRHGERGYLGGLVFSPDGRRLMSSGDKGIQEWDPAGRRPPTVVHGHEGVVLSLVFSRDGHTMASSGSEGTIRIWAVGSDTNPTVLRGHRGGDIWDIAFSPDGRQLASVGNDSTLRMWDATLPGDPMVLRGHAGPVWSAALSPDGRRVASGGEDQLLRIWPVSGGDPVVLRGHADEILDVSFSNDGQSVASASRDGTVRVWNASGADEPIVLTGPGKPLWSVAFSQNGGQVAGGAADGTIHIWNTTGAPNPVVLRGHQGQVRDLAFSPDGQRLISASGDNTVRIWPLAGQGAPVVLAGHEGPLWSVAVSPDGGRVASGGTDGTIHIWNTAGDPSPVVLRGHQGMVWGLAFSPDGQRLASSGIDGTARIWKATGDSNPAVVRGHRASIETIEFSQDGQSLLTSHDDGTTRLWTCQVCGPPGQVLDQARQEVTRQLTPDERATFGIQEN